jgi:hypothetical protein
MNPFEILVSNLNQMGFFGFLLPWLLMFAVTYGLLLKSKALGEDQKIIGVVSLVAAFFVVGYGGLAIGVFFSNLFGIAAIVLGGIIVTVLFVSMAGGDISKFAESKEIMALVAGIGIIVFMIVLGTFGVTVESDVIAAIFLVIVMAIAVVFIAGKQ